MSSAVASPASFLALASASPGGRRRGRVSAPPAALHAGATGRLALHLRWPTQRTARDGAVAARAEAAGVAGKGAAPERRSDDAAPAPARQTRARRGGAAGKVAKRRDPVRPVDRQVSGEAVKGSEDGASSPPAPRQDTLGLPSQNGALVSGEKKSIGGGDAAKGRGASPPAPVQDSPRLASQNGAAVSGESKSIVAAPPTSIVKDSGVILPFGNKAPETVVPATKTPPTSIVKVSTSDSGVILPFGNKAPETVVPATKTPPRSIVKVSTSDSSVILPFGNKTPETVVPATKTRPSSGSKFVSSASVPSSDTASSVDLAEKKGAKVVEEASEPKAPSPPSPAIQEAAWDFNKYIGFEEPAEVKDDGWVVADGAGSSEHHQNHDSGPLAGENVMNVIVVAAECSPWCKTGGLGDVVGALPKALARRGHRVMVVVPRYGDYEEAYDIGIRKYYKAAGQDLEVKYFHAYIDGVDFVFIDAPLFRHRQDDIYGGSRQEIMKRMILFCKAAVEVPWHVPCGGVPYGDGNLVFIANDWHTALLPVYLKAYYRDHGLMQYTRSVLVIHNIAHQGRGPVAEFPYTDLPEHYLDHFKLYDPVGGEHANYFAAGLKMADQVVAVSRGYLWELKTVEGGWGLHDIIRQNDWKINGIVNGIDNREWNPEVDVHLQSDGYTNYSLRTLDAGKRQCKGALQRELGLQVRDDVPLIGFIGRLDGQKGVEIIAEAMPWIVSQDVQLVMLGAGRGDLERMLQHFERQHNDKVRGWVGFSVLMAHRITAGADVLVMPSRFEPCGLNQLYAMAYGTVPVVHAVGGLRDTVSPFDPFGDSGLGWTFDRAEAHKLIEALGHCLDTYRNYRGSWRGLQERGMSQDFSWDHAAELYEEVLVKAKYQW